VAVVIALAGRRVDAPDAGTARFPLANVELVSRRLDQMFDREKATALVSSAACGADLLALNVAGARRMRRRIVLPFDRARFRATSVSDRPGDWGPLYDRVLAELDPSHDVVTLEGQGEGTQAYVAVNQIILRDAIALAREMKIRAIGALVWEGSPRGSDDVTASFGTDARALGLRLVHVDTL
jgi:hypothetical protein